MPSNLSAATTLALTGDLDSPSYAYWDGELDGYTFTVGAADLSVNWLGYYDAPDSGSGPTGDGLMADHNVGIWETSSGTLVASTVIVAGVGEGLVGAFRGHDIITPVTLTANTSYTIAGVMAGNDLELEAGFDLTGMTVNGITMDRGIYGTWPDMPTADWGSYLIGPNFGFTPIPEPSTPVLLGLAGLGVFCRRRRREAVTRRFLTN